MAMQALSVGVIGLFGGRYRAFGGRYTLHMHMLEDTVDKRYERLLYRPPYVRVLHCIGNAPRAFEHLWKCMCVRERERERKSVSVCMCAVRALHCIGDVPHAVEHLCVCVCVREREKERERV